MKKQIVIGLLISMHAGMVLADNEPCASTACYPIRSQGRDKTRQVVGSVGHVYHHDADSWNVMFSAMPEYTQSFDANKISKCLFGNDINCHNKCSSIKIQGSDLTTNRDAKAWLADYFYLPRDFDGTIIFNPRIQNVVVDLDMYVGLDAWLSNAYFRVYGPITHSRWNLRFDEEIVNKGILPYDAGVFTATITPVADLLSSFESYAQGKTPGNGATSQTLLKKGVNAEFNTIFQPLKFAQISKCRQTETGFADVRFELGWNVLNSEHYHLGFNVQAAAPTGTRKCPQILFDARVGNGNHGELGGGITGHYTFWQSESQESSVGLHLDANITHIFENSQQRTLDIKNKPNSRYMLALKFTQPVIDGLQGNDAGGAVAGIAPTHQFAQEFAPVANLSTVNTKVRIDVQADIVAMLNATWGGVSVDVGYNLWARSCEKVKLNCDCGIPLLSTQSWGLKGDARVYGFMEDDDGAGAPNLESGDAVALSSTQSKATIRTGTNLPVPTSTSINLGVDSDKFATAGGVVDRRELNGAAVQLKTSVQPVFLTVDDLDYQGTRGISHKVFGHLQYNFNNDHWVPFVGLGGFAELGKTESSSCTQDTSCNTSSNSCMDCALSQWGVWIKMGMSYS